MHTRPPLLALVLVCVCGCATENASTVSPPSPPTAEYCPETFDECVDLCRPEGVRHFGCWSTDPDEEFECECLDGSWPFDPSPQGSAIVRAGNPFDALEPVSPTSRSQSLKPVEGLTARRTGGPRHPRGGVGAR